jgi:hypothetical protein
MEILVKTLNGRKTDPSRRPLKHGEPQAQLTVACSGGQVYPNRRSRVENGNPGSKWLNTFVPVHNRRLNSHGLNVGVN